MPEGITGGLYVMALGMGIVFGALIIIMFVMIALERLFRDSEEVDEPGTPTTGAPSGETTAALPATGESAPVAGTGAASEVAAAIAVAIARARAGAANAGGAVLPGSLDNIEDERWDWLWDEGVDDYGTTRGSQYASI